MTTTANSIQLVPGDTTPTTNDIGKPVFVKDETSEDWFGPYELLGIEEEFVPFPYRVGKDPRDIYAQAVLATEAPTPPSPEGGGRNDNRLASAIQELRDAAEESGLEARIEFTPLDD